MNRIFSQNGAILPISEATVSLLNIEYSYGYGVYETLKVRNNKLYFLEHHLERLEHSSNILGISLPFSKKDIKQYLLTFVKELQVQACNIKIVLIGGSPINLYIFASAPLFPDRKLYKQGASLLTYVYERLFPTAKTLNMLPSYIAYKKAKENGCYDALLVDKKGIMLEGTRTNFCMIKGKTIYKAPADRVLEGVTFLTITPVAIKEGFTILEREIPIQDVKKYDGAFITSTSTKIMPISRIDDISLSIPEATYSLIHAYEKFLETED